jgi:hypothetical protein
MTRLLITEAHVLDPEAGALSDTAWIEIADGTIKEVNTGRAPVGG